VAAAAAPATTRQLPKVEAYSLPIDALAQVAVASGLQWVNSDADKIAAVQAAIAAEPQPAHVPRERPAPVALDDRPLVLVETRRDLRDLKLPFEDAPA
jgi:ribonuclease E